MSERSKWKIDYQDEVKQRCLDMLAAAVDDLGWDLREAPASPHSGQRPLTKDDMVRTKTQ